MSSEEEEINSILAQVYHAIHQNRDELIDKILPDRYVNSQISSNNYLKTNKPGLIGCTPLHLAFERMHKKTFDRLLIRGADFTLKNENGSTVLHEAIKFIYEDFSNFVWESRFSFINTIFQAYLNHKINENTLKEINPRDNNGISHFHIACITDNIEVVKLFLDHKAPVNRAVHMDSPHFPGYTPLHFAERFFAFETVKLLIERGADVNSKDARGMTPIHTFLEQHLKTVDLIHFGKTSPPYVDVGKIDVGVELNLTMMHQANRDGDDADYIGLSCLHVACTMTNNTRLVEELLRPNVNIDRAVKSDSPICPKYTALDFALESYNVETVKLLIRNKATLPEKFLLGCIPNYTNEDVHSIMSAYPNSNNALFSDNMTKVLDFVHAMKNVESFRTFLDTMEDVNVSIRFDSALLPCFTPLHLAVLFTARPIDMGIRREDDETLDLGLVQELLNRGADVNAPREAGYTALQDAFIFGKLRVVNLLLEHYNSSKNVYGISQLSTLHIACAAKNTDVVKKLLENCANPNLPTRFFYEWFNTSTFNRIFYNGQGCMFDICPGSTPLHVAVASRSYDIVKMLLDHNADHHAEDWKGFTPIHLLLSNSSDYDSKRIANLLLFWRRNVKDRSTDINCSYLHVACSFRRTEYVDSAFKDNFLLSSNVNAAITALVVNPEVKTNFSLIHDFRTHVGIYEESGRTNRKIKYILDHYLGYTPLDFAIKNDNVPAVKVLIQEGADILAKKPNGSTPFYELLSRSHSEEMFSYLQDIIKKIKSNNDFRDDIRKRLEEDSGLTMLHLAVYVKDVKMMKSLLDEGADVNARTSVNSPIWPGYTPLHVLLENSSTIGYHDRSYHIVVDEILDLLLDKQADVLLENAEGESSIYLYDRLSNSWCSDDWRCASIAAEQLRKLIKSVKTFEMKPVNYQGITLFHLACKYNETNTVEGYLKEDINYYSNLRIDYFNEEFGGCTPLLFILASDLTIWNTEESCFATIELLLYNGADLSAVDYHGNNAIHCAVSHKQWAPSAKQYSYLIRQLKQRGCNINHQNNEGKTPLHTAAENKNSVAVSKLLKAKADVFAVDNQGNNALHWAVSNESWNSCEKRNADLIQTLVQKCDVNHPNHQGRTPLHTAASNHNLEAVTELLKVGSDVLALDTHGNNALHCTVLNEVWNPYAKRYADLIQKLVQNGCNVNHQNKQGKTPLHTATENRYYEAVSELLSAGADWNIVNENDKTAFAYVLEPSFLPRGVWDDSSKSVIITYILYLCKLESTESTVTEIHRQVRNNVLENFEDNRIDLDSYYSNEWFEKESKKLIENFSTASRIKFNRERLSFFSFKTIKFD